jgi:hypothetical protein
MSTAVIDQTGNRCGANAGEVGLEFSARPDAEVRRGPHSGLLPLGNAALSEATIVDR